MADIPAITLRYFDCRGRAQPFRYFLRARNIAFIDVRISLKEGFAAWQQLKSDRSQTGPFTKLPVLHWGSQLIAETSVIHDWLHRKLGDEARLSEQDNLQHAMLASSCRSELTTPMAMLAWQEMMYPGADLKATVPVTLKRISDALAAMESALDDWRWFEQLAKRPLMVTDCLLWEVLDWADTIFGAAIEWDRLPALHHFHRQWVQAPLLRRMLTEHSNQLTARPQEAEALQRIRAAL